MADRKRVRRNAEEWRRMVAQHESGGLSQKEFCRREGLNENTFRLWRSRVGSSTNGSVPFVEVVPTPTSESPWSIELELPSGTKLRMRG